MNRGWEGGREEGGGVLYVLPAEEGEGEEEEEGREIDKTDRRACVRKR